MTSQQPHTETGIDGNCPTWPGASAVYSKAYALLERIAQRGHAAYCLDWPGRMRCFPSEDMIDLITALNKGDEETIKAILLDDNTRRLYNSRQGSMRFAQVAIAKAKGE